MPRSTTTRLIRPVGALLGAAAAAAALVPATALANPAASSPGNVAQSNPFRYFPKVPALHVTSTTITNGQPVPAAQQGPHATAKGAANVSPELSWPKVPKAKSYVVTLYDPQAPAIGGALQWVVANIPASSDSLPAGAGTKSSLLPAGAAEVPTNVEPGAYVGPSPEPHTGAHDFTYTVWALNVPRLKLGGVAGEINLSFGLLGHTVARGSIVCPTAAS